MPTQQSSSQKRGHQAAHELQTCTIKSPPHAYVHLQLFTDGPDNIQLDDLMVKSYCTAALKQFLGLTGQAIPIDILKTESKDTWLRIPAPDLGAFAAALTAWKGSSEDDTQYILRVKRCSNWLGTVVGTCNVDELFDG